MLHHWPLQNYSYKTSPSHAVFSKLEWLTGGSAAKCLVLFRPIRAWFSPTTQLSLYLFPTPLFPCSRALILLPFSKVTFNLSSHPDCLFLCFPPTILCCLPAKPSKAVASVFFSELCVQPFVHYVSSKLRCSFVHLRMCFCSL